MGPYVGPFTPSHIGWISDGHWMDIGWKLDRMSSVPNFWEIDGNCLLKVL